MQRLLVTNLLLLFFASTVFCQKDTSQRKLSSEESQEILGKLQIDSTKLIKEAGEKACSCIEKLYKKNDRLKATDGSTIKCIEEQAGVLQTTMQLMNSLKNPGQNNTITINTNKESELYKKYYFLLEEWMKDNCNALNILLKSNEQKDENSVSRNKEAIKEYNKGNEYLRKQEFENALPYYEKAVMIDSVFAFAWDNIGVCYRNLGNYEKAEVAYKESLKLTPDGKTALQNLPIVYVFQKKIDTAISAYKNILKYYPDDAEVYYGIGSIYFDQLKDYENALDNMCKAYNIYTKEKSAYRVDAQKIIGMIYGEMKKVNKEDAFNRILKENHITTQ